VAQALGVDALGFVFVPASKRYIDPQAARKIIDQVSPFVSCVGLFLNAAEVDVHQALSLMPTLVPQFHGQESAEYCDRFDRPYLKAIGVGGGMPADSDLARFTRCGGFLFDSNVPGELGGTGHTFDWSKLSKNMPDSLILAGGINVENVGRAIEQVAPHAVDVSSGVELEKGIKDATAIKEFMAAVDRADNGI